MSISAIKFLFNQWDANKDGFVSYQELVDVLAELDPSFTDEELDYIFGRADKDGNEKISIEEFIDSWVRTGFCRN